jgi:hypothetical protein
MNKISVIWSDKEYKYFSVLYIFVKTLNLNFLKKILHIQVAFLEVREKYSLQLIYLIIRKNSLVDPKKTFSPGSGTITQYWISSPSHMLYLISAAT